MAISLLHWQTIKVMTTENMEYLIDSISTLLSCLVCYYIGKYKAYSDIYEKVLKDYIRRHFKEGFKDDINKLNKGQQKWK